MHRDYHRRMTTEALHGKFSEAALNIIVQGNIRQDRILGQIGHHEFHFDNNAFEQGRTYIETNRREVLSELERGRPGRTWLAFGRLTHAAQDFYAHSNYVSLWLERYPENGWPPADEIDPMDEKILNGPLQSGRIYIIELLSWIPILKPFALPHVPQDAHAWMNLDTPTKGPKFDHAYAAAFKRTVLEYKQTICKLSSRLRIAFSG